MTNSTFARSPCGLVRARDPDRFLHAMQRMSEYFRLVVYCLSIGFVSEALAAPQLVVRGRGVVIANGDSIPDVNDGSDYGTVSVVNGSVTAAFLLYNEGDQNLSVSTPTITGLGTADFTIVGQPAATVLPDSLTTLIITYDPVASGLRTATVTFGNNDPAANPFVFNIQGMAAGTGTPEVNVLSSANVAIADGAATPSAADETDFGVVQISTGQASHTFRIANDGSGDLTLAEPTITGAHSPDFSIIAAPALTVAPGNQTTMTIRFTPSAAGIRTALVAFQNNDSDESPYDFAIQGTGIIGTEIEVSGNAIDIADGDATPQAQDGTDFGELSVVGSSIQRTFIIRNTGPNTLQLQAPSITGAAAGDFSILGVPAASVAPGAATSLVLSFDATTVGQRNATVSIGNNDINENPFDFAIRGTGLSAAAPEISVKSPIAEILDGDTSPSAAERTDFGAAQINFGQVTRTLTITNSGSATLNLAAPTISGATTDFSLVSFPELSLPPGESTQFTLRFAPTTTGTRSATITIANNDGNENNYDFTVQGVGATAAQDPSFTTFLKASDAAASQVFGENVAISGNTAVVGSLNEAAYVFVYDGASWTQQARLTASNGEANDAFGQEVAISGDTIVVGAYREDGSATGVNGDGSDNSASRSGAAYVFVRNGNTWLQQAYLKAANTGIEDFFGEAVAISGDTIVVGAGQEDSSTQTINGAPNDSGQNWGAAYVFVRNGVTWSQQAFLKPSNGASFDHFGGALAIEGDTIAAGAASHNNGGVSAGVTYVFVRNGSTWTEQAILGSPTPHQFNRFGTNVAISGNVIVIAAEDDVGAEPDAGAAYVFTRAGTAWGLESRLTALNGDRFDGPPNVAISRGRILLGFAPEDGGAGGWNGNPLDNSTPSAGAAYLFERAGTNWQQRAYIKHPHADQSDQMHPVAIDSDLMIVGVPFDASASQGVGGNAADNSAAFSGAAFAYDLGRIANPPLHPQIAVSGASAIANQSTVASAANGTDFGGVDWTTGTLDRTFTIHNNGIGTLHVKASLTDPAQHGSFTIRSQPGPIAPGGAGMLAVRYDPTSIGVHAAAISIANNDLDDHPFEFAIAGAGILPLGLVVQRLHTRIENDPEQPTSADNGTDFGIISISSGISRAFIISNASATTLTFDTPILVGPGRNDFSVSGKSLAPNSSTIFTLTFVPQAAGTRSAVVSIGSSDPFRNPYEFPISGIGGPAPRMELVNPSAASFASRDLTIESITNVFTITNSGGALLTLGPVALTGSGIRNFTVMANPATVLASGQTTTFAIKFDPFDIGVANAVVSIDNNDPDRDPFLLPITGTGTSSGPQMLVTGLGRLIPNRDSTPNQGDGTDFHQLSISQGSVLRSFLIRNVGSGVLTLSPPTINGGVGDFVVATNPSLTLAPGASTPFAVRYSASGQGTRSATVLIQNNDADDATYFFSIEGRGLVEEPKEALEAYLKASNSGHVDLLGSAVAIAGDTAVVGAPFEAGGNPADPQDNNQPEAGAAYVYVRSGARWSQQAYLKAAVPGGGDHFGNSVAIDGNTIVIGAPGEDGVNGDQSSNALGDSGAAYVFVRNGTSWTQQAYLKASNAGAADEFGGAISLQGDTLVVGAAREDNRSTGVDATDGNTAPEAGAAYVFIRNGSSWSQQAYLKSLNPDSGDGFGASVTVSGALVAVGAPGEDGRAQAVNGFLNDDVTDSGAAYVFLRSGNIWAQEAYVKPHNNDTNAGFGAAVAIDGGRLVVGAPGERSATTEVNGNSFAQLGDSVGAAYVFNRGSGAWSQEAFLKPFNSRAGHRFGEAVAIVGTRVVVGAPLEDSKALGAHADGADAITFNSYGAAYVFSESGGAWSQQYFLKASNVDADDEFGRSVALTPELVLVGAPGEDSVATGVNGNSGDNSMDRSGAAYVYDPDSPMIPDIAVLGAGNEIPDGATGASALLGTDFGSAQVPAGEVSRTFIIVNRGTGNLTLSAPTVSGAEAGDFTFVGAPGQLLLPGASTSFAVLFDPSAPGFRHATIRIGNNDPSENPFDFAVLGVGLDVLPEIEVGGNDRAINHLDFAPSNGDGTLFGSVLIGGGYVVRDFVITNAGTANLQINSVNISGSAAAEFTVVRNPSALLGPGQKTIFSIMFDPSIAGARNANVSIANNDGNEGSYTFSIQGFGLTDNTPLTALRNYLKASNTDEGDAFGFAVAISGDTAVIGAEREASGSSTLPGDNSAVGSGAAYVYVRVGNNWTLQGYLKAADPDPDDNFGHAVAIDGDLIAVGAPREDSGATTIDGDSADDSTADAGAVYVFARSGGVWSRQAYLKPPNAQAGDQFGSAVSVSGASVLVGAPLEDSDATGVNGDRSDNGTMDSGAAYIFTRFGTFWLYQTYLKPSNTGADDRFGHSVSMSGDTILIGAHNEDSNAVGIDGSGVNNLADNSGAAYVFQRVSGALWTQQAYLKASNTGTGDLFGWSVSLSGNTALIGAYAEDSGAGGGANDVVGGSGSAYVFLRSGATWSQQAQLKASNLEAGDSFGWSVSIDGDLAVVSAVGEDSATTVVDGNQADNFATDAGAAYAFRRDGANWTQLAYLKASNTGVSDFFGRSAAISGTVAIVGADLEDSASIGPDGGGTDNNSLQAGAAYTFDVGSVPGAKPTILQQTGATTVFGNGNLLLSINAANALSYQWLFNGAAISGQTGSTLSLTGLRRADSGLYSAIITGAGGSITSTPTAIRVIGRQRLALPIRQPDGRIRLRFRDDVANTLPDDLSRIEIHWREHLPTSSDNTWQIINSGFNLIDGQLQFDHHEAINRPHLFYRVIER